MKDPIFYNKDSTLTKYAFACGYVEQKETDTIWKQIYMEHNTFHVRSGPLGKQFTIWENFQPTELTKVRKFYNSIK